MLDQIRGGLFGVAIGDALGGTTEFMTRAQIEARYGWLQEIVGGGVWQLEAGETTDDTAMTIAVARGIIADPMNPIQPIGEEFLRWWATDPKDIGGIIRSVFFEYDGNWLKAASEVHRLNGGRTAGNGSLMRCLPVALAYGDRERMEEITRLQSRMTHYDPLAEEACLIYNRVAHRLLTGTRREEAIRLETVGTRYESASMAGVLPTGFVVDTMKWVLHILKSCASFADVVQMAANQGGDSDTIAAIAGGLAGLECGYEKLPAQYTGVIAVKEELESLARGLYRVRVKREPGVFDEHPG